MRLVMYSIYDRKAEVFNAPMVFQNDAVAKRALSQIIPSDADMSKFPEDFDVYIVGAWYNDTGSITQSVGSGDPAPIALAFRLSDLFTPVGKEA